MKRKNKNKWFLVYFWWLLTNTEATFIRLSALNLMTDSGGFSKTVQTTMPAGEYCNIIDSCSSKVRLGSLLLLRWDRLERFSIKVRLWSAVPPRWASDQLLVTPRWDSDQLSHHVEPPICWSTRGRLCDQLCNHVEPLFSSWLHHFEPLIYRQIF